MTQPTTTSKRAINNSRSRRGTTLRSPLMAARVSATLDARSSSPDHDRPICTIRIWRSLSLKPTHLGLAAVARVDLDQKERFGGLYLPASQWSWATRSIDMSKLKLLHNAFVFVGDGRKALFLRNEGDFSRRPRRWTVSLPPRRQPRSIRRSARWRVSSSCGRLRRNRGSRLC
jgi:hypothetical protein